MSDCMAKHAYKFFRHLLFLNILNYRTTFGQVWLGVALRILLGLTVYDRVIR